MRAAVSHLGVCDYVSGGSMFAVWDEVVIGQQHLWARREHWISGWEVAAIPPGQFAVDGHAVTDDFGTLVRVLS